MLPDGEQRDRGQAKRRRLDSAEKARAVGVTTAILLGFRVPRKLIGPILLMSHDLWD